MKSEDRMNKLLGPNAIETNEKRNEPEVELAHPVIKPQTEASVIPSTVVQNNVSQQLQDHTFRTLKSRRKVKPAERGPNIWIDDIVVFPVAALTRLFPTIFVPVVIAMILIILVQTSSSTSLNFWAVMVCNHLQIDPRKSFALKVSSLLEKAFQILLMFSFAFILTHAVVLELSTGNIHQLS